MPSSDDFNRADASSLGANWTIVAFSGGNGLGIASDQVVGASVAAIQGNVWTAATFDDDQWSEIETVTGSVALGLGGLGEFVGPMVRMTGTSGYVGIYFYNNNSPVLQIYRSDSGTFTQLGSSFSLGSTLAAGVKLRLTVTGSTLVFSQDGTARITVDDSAYASGAPGIVAYDAAKADNWSADNTTVTPPPTFEATLTSTDANGVQTYSVVSVDNGPDAQDMRVLVPDSPAAGVSHAVLLVLPNVAGADTTYGDGMETLRGLDAHNQYNLTLVEPQFGVEPWFADCANNADLQYETFMSTDIIPWLQANLMQEGDPIYLIGFSKSGLGAIDLIFKHPDVFQKAAAWDWPALQDHYTTDHGTGVGNGINYGTDANFIANYELTTAHITAWTSGADFTTNNRIWIGGYFAFQTDVATFDTTLTGLGILHTTETPTQRAHLWGSGWVPDALAALAGPAVTAADLGTLTGASTSGDSLVLTIPGAPTPTPDPLHGPEANPLWLASGLINGSERGEYLGYAVRETSGSASATIVLYDSTSAASGPIVEEIRLAAGAVARMALPRPGRQVKHGLYAVITGAVEGSVFQ